jgi:hypothetical protein
MTETEENVNVGGMYSKFSRITMIVVSMLLIFGGPTYVPYVMSQLHIEYVASVGVGAILFVVGIVFMLFLINKKVITP